ncbi:MAG: DHH family phosphoesterase, partial [Anaerolineales bacterium]
EIDQLLKSHEGEKHLIVLQEYPDPDAISCALAHRIVCETYDIETAIVHGGRISHQENIALVRLLNVQLQRWLKDMDLAEFDGAVFLDNQGTTAREIVNKLQTEEIPLLVIIDHHDAQDMIEAEFMDVRPLGSTATIYAEYLKEGLLDLDADEETHLRMATALMHGIFSDTKGFINAGEADFKAAAYLSQFRDDEMLHTIMSQARSRQTMAIIQRALENRSVVESYSIVGVGYLRSEDRDAIPQAADFLLTEENIHTSIVFGIVREDGGGETMVGSLRTSKLTLEPDDFIKEVFGQAEDGGYFGGGKKSAGAFEIPIEFLAGDADSEFEEMKWQVYEAQVKRKFFDKLGIDQDTDGNDREAG